MPRARYALDLRRSARASVPLQRKTRYRQPEQPCTVYPAGEAGVRLVFDEPLRAITPGQSAVLYDGDTVLGGGIIAREESVC